MKVATTPKYTAPPQFSCMQLSDNTRRLSRNAFQASRVIDSSTIPVHMHGPSSSHTYRSVRPLSQLLQLLERTWMSLIHLSGRKIQHANSTRDLLWRSQQFWRLGIASKRRCSVRSVARRILRVPEHGRGRYQLSEDVESVLVSRGRRGGGLAEAWRGGEEGRGCWRGVVSGG